MTNYLFEVSLLYGFCGLCYLLIKQNTTYQLLRGFLLLSLLMSLVMPFVPAMLQQSVQGLSIQLPLVLVGDISQVETKNIAGVIEWSHIFTLSNLVMLVSCIVFIRLVYNLIKLMMIINRATIKERDGHRLVYSTEVKNPCSLFNYILLPDPLTLTDQELDVIIKHENFHIKFLHSFERVFFEVTNIILWWHPVHYLFRKELALLHEYEVDQAMLNHVQATDYKEILLQLIINPPGLRMTNPFSSNIKKRIIMLNTRKKKSSKVLIPFMGVFMVASLLLIHSCTAQDGELESATLEKKNSEESISYTTEFIDTTYTFNTESMTEEIEIEVKKEIEVFKSPDVMPLFPGCSGSDQEALKACSQNKLLHYVYSNIVYPSEASDNQIEGMVVVKFVVGSNGVIESSEIVRTPGYGLSESVNEMMVKMEEEIRWIPGKHNGKNVNVQYVLPVKFKLSGEEKSKLGIK